MIKHFFCDIDGTLWQDGISKDTLQQIHNFVAQGNKFYLASGRLDNEILHVINNYLNISTDFRISQNGTVIKNSNNEIIYSKSIDKDLLPMLVAFIKTLNLNLLTIKVSDEKFRYLQQQRSIGYSSEFGDFTLVKENLLLEIGVSLFPNIILLCSNNYNYLMEIQQKINLMFNNKINAVMTADNTLELVSYNNSKGEAIDKLVNILNINKNSVIVAGDNENDITMFNKFYENSFCMQSAKDHVKKHAKNIVKEVAEVINFTSK